jgi:hypothetical protein
VLTGEALLNGETLLTGETAENAPRSAVRSPSGAAASVAVTVVA